MRTPNWIAELRVILVHPDGRRQSAHIGVGAPSTLANADPGGRFESHCPIEIDGLHAARHPMIAGGTLGALLAGVQHLGALLRSFVDRGGRVLHEDGSAVDLASLFGPLLGAGR